MQNNMTEKSNSIRTPLTQLINKIPTNSDLATSGIDGAGLTNFKNFMVRTDDKSQDGKIKKESGSQDKDSTENEYVKTLKKALGEALDENDQLRNRVAELEALLSAANDEIEQRDKAILELAALLESRVKANQNGSQGDSIMKK